VSDEIARSDRCPGPFIPVAKNDDEVDNQGKGEEVGRQHQISSRPDFAGVYRNSLMMSSNSPHFYKKGENAAFGRALRSPFFNGLLDKPARGL